MTYPDKSFYDNWAACQASNPHRDVILKWKAVNLANLVFRTCSKDQVFHSICEIGGAEGVVLNTIGYLLGAKKLVNYELSSKFCEVGSKLYPNIKFMNKEFGDVREAYDIIVLSDIIEHIDNEDKFLENVSANCRFALIKMPIEKCLTSTDLVYWLRGRIKPQEYRYGPGHINGHLRGYSLGQAYFSIAKYFNILNTEYSDVSFFYGSHKQRLFKRLFGTRLTILLFGGALFALGRSKKYSDKNNPN